jgi:hypothetical protein
VVVGLGARLGFWWLLRGVTRRTQAWTTRAEASDAPER